MSKNAKQWKLLNRDRVRLYNRQYAQANAEKIAKRRKKNYEKNRERELQTQRLWKDKNCAAIREYNRNYTSKRYGSDPIFRMRINMLARMNLALRKNRKTRKTNELIGCSWDFLKGYIEAKFVNGMSWENRTEWHIDHIKPLASFDLSKEEEQKKAFHYSNLQPLWEKDNLSKKDKVA